MLLPHGVARVTDTVPGLLPNATTIFAVFAPARIVAPVGSDHMYTMSCGGFVRLNEYDSLEKSQNVGEPVSDAENCAAPSSVITQNEVILPPSLLPPSY